MSSKRPHGAQARPRRLNAAHAARRAPARPRAGSRSSGTSSASARARRRPGRGTRSTSSVAPQPAPSIICSSEPATPGIETSRAAWQSPASATSTSASPSSRSRSGGRSCSAREEVLRLAHVPAVERERGEQHVAGTRSRRRAAGAARRRCTRPTAPAGGRASGGRRPPGRRAARTPTRSRRARPRRASRSGVTSMSTIASGRPPIARTSDTFVTTAAEPAPNGSAARNGGEIASPQTTRYPSPCGTSAASSPSMPAPSRATSSRSRLPSRPGADRTAATSASRSGHPRH